MTARRLAIATWNVNSLKVRLPHVLDWLTATGTDILGLQEIKLTDDNFPLAEFAQAGYDAVFSGQRTYNGVALLVRRDTAGQRLGAPTDIHTDLPDLDDPQRRVLAASLGDWRIVNVYVPNGQSVGSEKYAYKLDWLAKLHAYLAQQLTQHKHVLVMGDFNIAPEDRDVHDPVAWEGKVLCSPAERDALQRLLALGFVDSFRQFEQPDGVYSWWDYRAAAFRRGRGLRIDLILTNPAATRALCAARVDPEPRGRERPSDHAPSVAEFTV